MGVSGMQTSGAALISFLKIISLIAFNQLGSMLCKVAAERIATCCANLGGSYQGLREI